MALRRRNQERSHELFAGFADVSEIGVGSLATVYRAREIGTSRLVALKLLNVRDASPRSIESFERESVALGALSSHPNIVTLYRNFRTPDGRPVLVLELCSGAIADRLHGGAGLAVQDAVAIGIKVAGALETAHRGGILHRDVKPQNILVTEFGEPALADFGVAMLQSSTQTTAGLFDFTTLHAAPELLEGAGTSAATDVYELASSLYQLIAGQSAFRAYEGESPASVILRILRDPVRPLSGSDIPVQLSDLLIRAMSKDMGNRPPTAAEFAAELAEVEIAQGWPRTQFLIRDAAGAALGAGVTRMPDAVPRGLPSALGAMPAAIPTMARPLDPAPAAEPAPIPEPEPILAPEPTVEPAPMPEPAFAPPAPAAAAPAAPAAPQVWTAPPPPSPTPSSPKPSNSTAPPPMSPPAPEPEPADGEPADAKPAQAPLDVEPIVGPVAEAVTEPVVETIAVAPVAQFEQRTELLPAEAALPDASPITPADTVAPLTESPAAEPEALPEPVAEPEPERVADPEPVFPAVAPAPSLLEQFSVPLPPPATPDPAPTYPLPSEPTAASAEPYPLPDEAPEPVTRRDPGAPSWWAPLDATGRASAEDQFPLAPAAAEPRLPEFPTPPSGHQPAAPTAVPIWATRTPAPAPSAAPQFVGDLAIDPASLRPRLTVRSGTARLTADESQLTVRSLFRKERLPWSQVNRFEQHFPGGEPNGSAPGVLLAITPTGAVELSATKRVPGELRSLHALLDAYRVRALARANR